MNDDMNSMPKIVEFKQREDDMDWVPKSVEDIKSSSKLDEVSFERLLVASEPGQKATPALRELMRSAR